MKSLRLNSAGRVIASVLFVAFFASLTLFDISPARAQCSGSTINCTITLTDTQFAKTTAYTIGASENDCGARVVAQGSAFYALTFNAASGYAAGCRVVVTNNDSGAGKTLTVNGLTYGGFGDDGCGWGNLCPGQTAEYVDISSAWVLARNPGRWRPQGSPILYVSTSGSDTNDCLSTGTTCTLAGTCLNHSQAVDTSNATNVTIQLEDGTYTGPTGTNLCDIEGNYGGGNSLRFLNGDSTTPANTVMNVPVNGVGLFTKDLGETEEGYLTWEGGSGSILISGAQFSVVDVLAGNNFGATGPNSIAFQFSQSASLNFDAAFTWSGTQSTFLNLTSNANLLASNAYPITVPTALSPTTFIQNTGGAIVWRMTFTGAGVSTTTGNKYFTGTSVVGTGSPSCLFTGGTNPNSLFPGSTPAVFPVGSCTDFPIGTTWANFSAGAACNANTVGIQYAIEDSTVNTWGAAITTGGGAYPVTASCDGSNLTVAGK